MVGADLQLFGDLGILQLSGDYLGIQVTKREGVPQEMLHKSSNVLFISCEERRLIEVSWIQGTLTKHWPRLSAECYTRVDPTST
mmetsp:Transcript_151477/g.264643  ORF Transcript_151477/g.264643 Transcript_151477/m.264643 type:complete len:84 (-) Transcript_151477:198-449(-)